MISRFSLTNLARSVTATATSVTDPRRNKAAASSNTPIRSSLFHSSSLSSSSVTATAQSIVHKHSSSHSSSSSSYSSSLLALLAAGAIVGGAVIAHDSDSSSLTPSAAASASSPPPTPTLSFQLPGADDEEKSTPQKKTEKKSSEPLKNPGKFDHPLRDSQMVLAVPVFGGAKFQWAYPYFHPEAEKEISGMMDKQLTSMVVVNLGDPQGSNAMLNVISQLGQTHEMRAMWDTNGSTVGKYKYRGDRFSFKSEFQIAPMYNAIMVGGDYRGDSWTGQAYLLQGQEIELSFMKSLSANIIAGVQLRHVMDQQTLLDYIAKYTTSDGSENIVLSQKMNNLIAAYTRRLDPYCSLATEFRLNQMNHESQCVVGLIYRRPNSFTYQANIHSGGVVSVLCEQTIVPGIIFGVTGAMVHDGSGESQFGFSFTLGG